MPPETLPWERERSKDRRHDRPPQPPYDRPPTPFVGSRARLPGNGRQGPWRYHSAEPDRGYSPSRVSDKFMGDEGLRPSGYRVESRYNRFNRENSDAYAQRDMRGNNWEIGMSPNNLGRPHFGSDRRSIDDRFSSRQKDTKGHFWENGRMQNGSGQRSVEDKGSFGRRDHRGKSRENELFEKRDPCLVDDKQPFEKKGLKRRYQEYGTLPYSSGRPHSLNDHRPLDERRSSGEKLRGKSCENGVFPNRSSRIDSVSDQRSMDDEDSKGRSLENVVAPNISGRIRSVGEQSPVDDMLLTSPTDPYLARTQEKHSKDHYDKYSGAIDVVTSPKLEKEKALGSSDWTHLKWNRSVSLSSRGSELKSDVQPRMDTPLQSPPGDVGGARETTSVASSEEAGSRKKPRLGWGEGLAKFEKKKVEGPIDDSATKPGLVARISGEPSNLSNLTGKSPRVASFLECASPATPYSTACSSSPGIEDKTCIRSAANLDCEFSYSSGSPNLPPREKTDGDQQKEICLGNVELTSIDNISSSLTELIQLEDRTVVESSLDSLSAMDKLLVLKGETLKALEATEAEIDLLEDGLRELNSESEGVEKTKYIQPLGDVKCTAPLNSVSVKSSEDQILASNKETAKYSFEIFARLLPSSNCSAHGSRAKKTSRRKVDVRILDQLAFKKRRKVFEDRINALKYRVTNHIWKKGLERTNVKKDYPKSKKRLDSNLQRPQGSNQKHRSRARLSNAGNSTLEPSPETIRFATKLLSDSQPKVYRDSLKMPALMNIKERMASRFISTNGLVEDPCAMEKERALINPWTKEEKYIFMDKLAVFGKNFSKISNFLDHKTTADCVEFYYKNHKSDDFVKLKKKQPDVSMQRKSYSLKNYLVGSGKIYRRENNAASLHVLGEACQEMQCSKAPQIDRNVEKSRSRELDVSINERENEAANVLVGICDSVPSLDHGGSNMRMTDRRVGGNDETCSDNDSRGDTDSSDWNDEERFSFIQALKSCGKDFAVISRHVVTRSRVQCKRFFTKTKRTLGLDIMLSGSCEESRNDNNDGSNDNEGTCRVEADPVVSGEKAPFEGDKDVIPPRPCDEDKDNNSGRGIDENMVVEASGEDNNDGGNDNEGACRVEAYPVVSGEKAPLEGDKDVIPPTPCDADKDDNSGRGIDENMVVEASGEDNNDGGYDNEGACRVEAYPVVSVEKATLEGDKDVIPPRPCDEDKDDNSGRSIDRNMVVEASGEDIEVNIGVEETDVDNAEDDDEKMEERAAEDSSKAASESAAVSSNPPRILFDLNPPLEEEAIPVEEPKRIFVDLNPPFEEAAFITPLEEQSHTLKYSVSGDALRPTTDKNCLQRCSAKKKGGDIKLFGKILRSQAEGGSVDASSTTSDDGGSRNHYVGVGNNPGVGYGLWNANVVPAGYVHGSADSALLLAKLPHNITGQQQQQQRMVVLNGLPHDITGQQQQRPVVLNGLPHDITRQQQQQRRVLNRLPQRGELQAIRKRQETMMQEHRQLISEALMNNGRIGMISGLGVSDPVAAMQRHFAAMDKDRQN